MTGSHHYAALSIAALMVEGLVADKFVGGKKLYRTPSAYRLEDCVPRSYPARALRHVATSITPLRHRLSYLLIARLRQCPFCGRASAKGDPLWLPRTGRRASGGIKKH